jgi:Ser-tRNA(Ala) deacylase AlaX
VKLKIIRETMNTDLLYLNDNNLKKVTGNLIKMETTEQGQYCIFDQTIFYPKGGGQSCDVGAISNETNTSFDITYTGFHEGQVLHFGNFDDFQFTEGAPWELTINPEIRLINAKGHTAGHLVHLVMEELVPGLTATKGHHFPNDAYIRFEGLTQTDRKELIIKANANLKKYIAKGLPVKAEILTMDQLKKQVKNIPFNLPEDKPLRTIAIGDYLPVPCGGIHLNNINELQSTTITKIKHKKGNTVVGYSFD